MYANYFSSMKINNFTQQRAVNLRCNGYNPEEVVLSDKRVYNN